MRNFLLAAWLLSSSAALAQPAFTALDRNRDGYLDRLEAATDPEIAKRFPFFDFDRDSRLSEKEYAIARADYQRRVSSDAALSARVKAALLAKGIPSKSISVQTYEGRVQLSGHVSLAESASRAGRVTATVNGVRTVHNNIAVVR